MEPLQVLLLTFHQGINRHATSALPDAPVVPYEPPQPRFVTTRKVVARGLRTVAARVDPAEAKPARV